MTMSSEALRAIEPRALATWLRTHGWTLVDTDEGRRATYVRAAEDGEYAVDVPLDPTFRDYARRVAEVLDTVGVSHRRPVAWVLAEVRASTHDLIRLRSTGPAVEQGRVPLELGTRLFTHARDLMLAAACSAVDPRPVYRTRKPTPAVDLLTRMRFAAPEAGSFVITIHVPVPPELQPPLPELPSDTPLPRATTVMLARATASARRAAESASLDTHAGGFLGGASAGVSANLCEALAGLVDGESTHTLDLSFAWAASRGAPDDTPSQLHLGADLTPLLREGARLLRSTATTADFELEGAVVHLHSDDPARGGVATLAGRVDDEPRKVAVPMGAADYAIAHAAHGRGQLVRCVGELRRRGRQFQLEQVRGVAAIVDEG